MIDWSRVDELRDEVGEDDFAEIASLFLGELAESIAELGSLSDPAALRDGFHGLKGAALNLGFFEVARLAAMAELEPENVDMAAIRQASDAATSEICARHPGLAA